MVKVSYVVAAAWLLAAGATPAGAQIFNPKSFTLPNGLQVVVVENHRAPVVTNMVWYKVGADDEVPGKTGLAHMLEHMMFQGTTTVSPGAFSRQVAENGGNENAFTTADTTAFYQNIGSAHLPLVLKLEADRMANLAPQEQQFATEHQAVLEELRMRLENSPAAELSTEMSAMLYLNTPYHHPVIGWRSEVEGLTLDDVKAFYHRWYAPNNAILLVSGDVTVDTLKPLVEQYFGPLQAHDLPARPLLVEPPPLAPRSVVLKDPNTHQPAWARQYLAPSYVAGDSQHAYALQVLVNILGDGNTSRLFRSLVLDQKVAVFAGASYDPQSRYQSNFEIDATPADGVDLDKLEAAVQDQIKAVLSNGVTAEEVDRAKRRLSNRLAYMRDGYQTGARVLGAALAAGQSIDDLEAWPQRIAAVTTDQVNAAARAVLNDAGSVTGRLLPGEGPPTHPVSDEDQVPMDTRGEIR